MSASTATSANDRQVGGQHYKTGGVEHWDLFGPEYLIGCASKYVARHMEKDGRRDLEKSIHYCEKLAECLGTKTLTNTIRVSDMLDWARGTRMTGYEIAICYEIMCAVSPVRAIELLHKLIEIKYPKQPHVDPAELPQNRPGTPEDGGHHARQPVEEDEGEVLWTLDRCDVAEKRLPPSLSTHDWQHRCSEAVQGCYQYDVSAARYLIKDDLRHYTHNCTARD